MVHVGYTVTGMTALNPVDEEAGPADHPLAPGVTAEVIRTYVLAEHRPRFDEDLAQARATGDAGHLWDRVEYWRNVAAIYSDPEALARITRYGADRAETAR